MMEASAVGETSADMPVLNRMGAVVSNLRSAIPLNEEILLTVTAEEMDAGDRLVFQSGDVRSTAQLNRRQLACAIRLLMKETERLRRQVLLALLERHNGGTVRRMAFVALQMEPDNAILLQLVIRLYDHLSEEATDYRAKSAISSLKRDSCVRWINHGEPVTETVLRHFRRTRMVLPVYMLHQGIIRELPFAFRLRNAFFESCVAEDYSEHLREFHLALELGDESQQARILAQYLKNHQMETFPSALTQELIARYGSPDEGVVWNNAAALLAQSGADNLQLKSPDPMRTSANPLSELRYWWMRNRLQAWWGAGSRKFWLVSRYVRRMHSLMEDVEERMLQLNFTHFVLVDFLYAERCSWLCLPLEIELRGKELISMLQGYAEHESRTDAGRSIPDAKRILFDKIDSTIVQLNYPEVGILYAHDLMDVRLGLKDLELDF